jgi:hypothetical protein
MALLLFRKTGLLRKTGLRWKLSAAIAAVSALVAVVLSFVVHNAARASMIDNSRDVQMERVVFAQTVYESTGRLAINARLDDDDLPSALRHFAAKDKRATFVQEHGNSPVVWAETPLSNGRVLSMSSKFSDTFAVLDDLDQALILGSAAVVLGGTALGGGRGSVIATTVGVLFLSQLEQVVSALGAKTSVQYLIQGAIVALGMGIRNVPWRQILPGRSGADDSAAAAPPPQAPPTTSHDTASGASRIASQ